MALISVIIPVYNGEKTIKETIESVLKQTYINLEVIVINSDSTDSTLEIISNIQDERIKTFTYSQANGSVNRNRGFSHACGEFISFLDADDLWTNDKLELQMKMLNKYPQTAVAYSWTDYIDYDSKFLKPGKRVKIIGDAYTELLLTNFLENGSNPLIRRKALETIGGFDESLAAAQDWDMWLRLAASYEFVVVPKAQILYRMSVNSMSVNVLRQEAASLEVIERGFSHHKAESVQHFKKDSLSLLYKYLTFKSLEVPPEKLSRWTSARFFWNFIKYDTSVLTQRRLVLIAVLKIAFPKLCYYLSQFWKGKSYSPNKI
ncbi:glycosyltransferase [Anabaena sp. CCY 0017]|uniref:glycosyltransferase n=1 Tax=Anabaena sp. CCY 0017 TaxID=3103866 RepID=UPI0039C6D13A